MKSLLKPTLLFIAVVFCLLQFGFDGTDDCVLNFKTWENMGQAYHFSINPKGTTSVAVTDEMASVFEDQDVIDDTLTWSTSTVDLLFTHPYEHYGNWLGKSKGYLGIRLQEDGNFFYAWIRLHLKNNEEMWVVDFGLQSETSMPVHAGEGMAVSCTSLYASDKNDFFDGRDIEVSFTRAIDETIFKEYRIIVAKADDTTTGNLDVMNDIPESGYYPVLSNQSGSFNIYVKNLLSSTIDKDGDAIKSYTDYKVHLLNVSKNSDPSENILSTPSPVFYLQAFSDPVTEVVAYDNNNNNEGSDITIQFKTPDREDLIAEYRCIIAPYKFSVDLDLDSALKLSPEYYKAIAPGNWDEIVLNNNQLDLSGEAITNNKVYVALVLSVADSVFSKTSALSQQSRRFILKNPDDIKAGQTEGEHLVHYTFDPPVVYEFGEWLYLDIDLNQDSITDFVFEGHYHEAPAWGNYNYEITPERDNLILICKHYNHNNWIEILNKNYQIGEEYRWLSEKAIFMDYDWHVDYGTTVDDGHGEQGERFIFGLCMMDNQSPVYGWLELKISYIYLTIYGYGYQDFSSSINDFTYNDVVIYPNPLTGCGKLLPPDITAEYTMEIISLNGTIVQVSRLKTPNYRFSVETLPAGLYIYRISKTGEEKFIIRGKLLVQ